MAISTLLTFPLPLKLVDLFAKALPTYHLFLLCQAIGLIHLL